jgi:hypothetical protein
MKRSSILCLAIGLLGPGSLFPWGSPAARADVTNTTGTLAGTRVRCLESWPNETGREANDFHLYAYIQERNAARINGARVNCQGAFTRADLTLKPANGTRRPPPGMHGCSIKLSGGAIPPGDSIKLTIDLFMTERNVQLTDSLFWTKNDTIIPGPPLRRRQGWRVERSAPLPNGEFRHVVCIENGDDSPALLEELRLLPTMVTYADIENDIDWSSVPPVQNGSLPPEPPVIIPAHGKWCYDLHTAQSFVGGHVYLDYILSPVGRRDSSPRQVADHPVDAPCDDPACMVFPQPMPGACITPAGCISALYEYDCVDNLNGIWYVGQECWPPGIGACCRHDGSCTFTAPADCQGNWLGEDRVCDPNPCPPPANACGTVFVHDANLLYHGPVGSQYCFEGSPPIDCMHADTEIDGGGNVGMVWKVYAAFPPWNSPRLRSTAFGVSYPASIVILDHGPCIGNGFELPGPGWPASGTGTSVMWENTQTTTLVEAYWFAGYADSGTPGVFQLIPGEFGGVFMDDSTPAVVEPIAGYGSLGFNQPGSTSCPEAMGACCVGTACTITCAGLCSGTWIGSGASCSPNPCLPPTGACCNPDTETCTMSTESACLAPNIWHPNWTTCDPNPCPVSRAPTTAAGVGEGILGLVPNPFTTSSVIWYRVSKTESLRFEVFDASGRLVQSLELGPIGIGVHSLEWNGRGSGGDPAPPGVYFVRLRAGEQTWTRALVRIG